MPISNPSGVIFSTAYAYFLNYKSSTGSVNIPSTSYAVGQVKNYSLSIPIERVKDYSQIKVNLSFDSSKWYIFPFGQVAINSNFVLQTVGNYSGANLNLAFYVVNSSASSATSPSFDVSITADLFVTPS